jgi:hypothetical protein
MGLDSNVLLVGRFSEEIVDCLNYGPEFYEDTKPGTIVTAHLLNCNTSDQSRRLARVLGTEPWDFNTHCIIEENIDWAEIYDMMESCIEWEGEHEVHRFERLLEAKFICIYQPNG